MTFVEHFALDNFFVTNPCKASFGAGAYVPLTAAGVARFESATMRQLDDHRTRLP